MDVVYNRCMMGRTYQALSMLILLVSEVPSDSTIRWVVKSGVGLESFFSRSMNKSTSSAYPSRYASDQQNLPAYYSFTDGSPKLLDVALYLIV
jgi:hypothetical protein